MRRAKSFCPAHITGFFIIKDASENPLQTGSLGAGFCIDRGTFTAVRRRHFRSESAVRINGRRVSAPVSLKTAELFFAAAEISPEPLEIKHRVKVPQGAGFGTSGAGALSLALALNRLYGTPLNEEQTAGVAHTADVLCRTGLGTVVGEQRGGFELRLKAGAPPFGLIDGFFPNETIYVVFALFGPLSTVRSLSDPLVRKRINRSAGERLLRLQNDPTPQRFLTEAADFSTEAALFSENGRKAAALLEKYGKRAAMLMFGDGVYTFCFDKREAQKLKKMLKKNLKSDILISTVSEKGARIR